MRRMRSPEKWVGRRIPIDLDIEHDSSIWWNFGVCDDCRCFHLADDLHALLYPASDEDWELQEALHVEEAESFCPACLRELEEEADKLDPEWRKRHWLA